MTEPQPRIATISRATAETQMTLTLNLDGQGKNSIATGVPFLDHMLQQIACHGLVDLTIDAKGDTHIDDHHTVEDIGIVLGKAFSQALGDKRGIQRYGHAYVPLDEALSRAVIDCSGRPMLVYQVKSTRERIGRFDVELVREFFQGFVNHAAIALHLDSLRGENAHHIVESIFKAFGRALRMAVTIDSRIATTLPSTKQLL